MNFQIQRWEQNGIPISVPDPHPVDPCHNKLASWSRTLPILSKFQRNFRKKLSRIRVRIRNSWLRIRGSVSWIRIRKKPWRIRVRKKIFPFHNSLTKPRSPSFDINRCQCFSCWDRATTNSRLSRLKFKQGPQLSCVRSVFSSPFSSGSYFLAYHTASLIFNKLGQEQVPDRILSWSMHAPERISTGWQQ